MPEPGVQVRENGVRVRFVRGTGDEFRWLSAVLLVERPAAGSWARTTAAIRDGVERVIRPELRPEGRAAFDLLWDTPGGRLRRSKGLAWDELPAEAGAVVVSAQVAPSTGVPSADGGYVAFAEAQDAGIGYRGRDLLLLGIGVVQGALRGGTASAAVQAEAVDWLCRSAAELSALGGWAGVDFTNSPQSVYDNVCDPHRRGTNPRSTVYGYGPWTLLAHRQVAALGGPDRLAAVAEVRELPGGYLLAALGEDANAVDVRQLRALRDALAPVLAPARRSVEEYFARKDPHTVKLPYRI